MNTDYLHIFFYFFQSAVKTYVLQRETDAAFVSSWYYINLNCNQKDTDFIKSLFLFILNKG